MIQVVNEETVTLGMGCFWSPDALFGQLPGVIRTRVGYAGGTAESPTYREMGDHTETVEMDYDPGVVTLDQLLDVFWSSHNPGNINDYKGRQYRSLVLYRGGEQLEAVRRVMEERERNGQGRPDTEIRPFQSFQLAEERHQKYYLRRFPDAVEKLAELCPTPESLRDSTIAARLNGLAKGYTNLERIIGELRTWESGETERERWIGLIRRIKW